MLAGKRYDESVDMYSFGIVLLEVVERGYPFAERRKRRKKGARGLDMDMLQEIAKGYLRPEPSKGNWMPKILSLFRRCVKFEPLERPSFSHIARELEDVLHDEKMKTFANENNKRDMRSQGLLWVSSGIKEESVAKMRVKFDEEAKVSVKEWVPEQILSHLDLRAFAAKLEKLDGERAKTLCKLADVVRADISSSGPMCRRFFGPGRLAIFLELAAGDIELAAGHVIECIRG